MAALQFRQAGQTNCGKHQVTKKRKIKKWPEIRRRKLEIIFRERNTAVTSYYNQTTIDQAKSTTTTTTTK